MALDCFEMLYDIEAWLDSFERTAKGAHDQSGLACMCEMHMCSSAILKVEPCAYRSELAPNC